jgi:RNA polymerase sigma-70 factor (ECF subfamily)
MVNKADYTDDLVLAGDVKRGEERAFDYLFRTRYASLCRFAAAFVNDIAVAEDIVQELFTTIWQHGERLDARRPVDNYLFTSTRNACLNYLRDRRVHATLDTLAGNVATPDDARPDDDPRLDRLRAAVEALPLQCKLIFKLVVLEEMKYREAAERLDISVNTVKTQLKIAYKTLREKLDRDTLLLYLALFPGNR